MRRFLVVLAAAGLVLGLANLAQAQAPAELQAVLDKAVKAHGGEAALAKYKAAYSRSKGSLDLLGGITFTQESWSQDMKVKEMMQLEVMGQNVSVTTIYNGKEGWIQANGQTMDMDENVLKEVQEGLFMAKLMKLAFAKDKSIELSALGESKVEGKPAVGVKITSKGHRDVNLYFDKETGLIVKIDRTALDPMSGQEVQEERIIQEYQKIDGLPSAKKVVVNRDGKKYLELEVLEVKFLEKIDDNEFAKP